MAVPLWVVLSASLAVLLAMGLMLTRHASQGFVFVVWCLTWFLTGLMWDMKDDLTRDVALPFWAIITAGSVAYAVVGLLAGRVVYRQMGDELANDRRFTGGLTVLVWPAVLFFAVLFGLAMLLGKAVAAGNVPEKK
jgi:hypothetical protein